MLDACLSESPLISGGYLFAVVCFEWYSKPINYITMYTEYVCILYCFHFYNQVPKWQHILIPTALELIQHIFRNELSTITSIPRNASLFFIKLSTHLFWQYSLVTYSVHWQVNISDQSLFIICDLYWCCMYCKYFSNNNPTVDNGL